MKFSLIYEAQTTDALREGGQRVFRETVEPNLMKPNHAYGSVDNCIAYAGRLQEAGVDEVLFLCQMATVPHSAQLDTIRNIGEHVIPFFSREKVRACA